VTQSAAHEGVTSFRLCLALTESKQIFVLSRHGTLAFNELAENGISSPDGLVKRVFQQRRIDCVRAFVVS
jgi:hypothetical protein